MKVLQYLLEHGWTPKVGLIVEDNEKTFTCILAGLDGEHVSGIGTTLDEAVYAAIRHGRTCQYAVCVVAEKEFYPTSGSLGPKIEEVLVTWVKQRNLNNGCRVQVNGVEQVVSEVLENGVLVI